MKDFKWFCFIGIISCCFISCNNTPAEKKNDSLGKNGFALPLDTAGKLNYKDADGQKQGKWVFTGRMVRNIQYPADAIIEEGHYLNNLQEGLWIYYNPDGTIKEKRFYSHGMPDATPSVSFNFVDEKGKRQGMWAITAQMINDSLCKSYLRKATVEKGIYIDNVKVGLWTIYNPNGTVQRAVMYKDGKMVK
jgi:antitoxin component YwqK of YwqJK toxin-antitoxin module